MITAANNPFRSSRIESLRFRFHDGDWELLMERLKAQRERGAIIGPKGSGKTTMIEELAVRLSKMGLRICWIRLNEEWRARPLGLRELPHRIYGPHECVLVDGAEQLGPLEWLRLRRQARHAGAWIITAHRSARLPLLYHCRTDTDLLIDLMAELLEAEEMRSQCQQRGTDLFPTCDGNIREVFRNLYLEIANAKEGMLT